MGIMWRSHTTIAALMAALIQSAAAPPAMAFQEIPVPPPASHEPASRAEPQAGPPALQLAMPRSDLDEEAGSGGVKVFGYTVMPKLDFGLELLYGQDDERLELEQGLTTFDVQSDVTVLGKVKRRF